MAGHYRNPGNGRRPSGNINTFKREGRSNNRHQGPSQVEMNQLAFRLKEFCKQDVDQLLRRIGYPVPSSGVGPQSKSPSALASEAAERYLKSPEGYREVERQIQLAIKIKSDEYLQSPDGKLRLADAKAMVLSQEITQDDDLLNRMCRDEAIRVKEKWLASSRGQEAVRSLIAEAISQGIDVARPSVRRKWLDEKLGVERFA